MEERWVESLREQLAKILFQYEQRKFGTTWDQADESWQALYLERADQFKGPIVDWTARIVSEAVAVAFNEGVIQGATLAMSKIPKFALEYMDEE